MIVFKKVGARISSRMFFADGLIEHSNFKIFKHYGKNADSASGYKGCPLARLSWDDKLMRLGRAKRL